jgi:hypothetical protein
MHRRQRWAPKPPPRAWARSAASSAPRTGSAVCVQRAQRRHSLGVPGLGRRHIVAGDLPVRRRQTAPCWVEITQHGRFLFTVSTGSGTISRCVIAPSGALTLLGSTPVGATGGRVSAGPDLPAVRTPDLSHPGRRRHRVFHGGRNTNGNRAWRLRTHVRPGRDGPLNTRSRPLSRAPSPGMHSRSVTPATASSIPSRPRTLVPPISTARSRLPSGRSPATCSPASPRSS